MFKVTLTNTVTKQLENFKKELKQLPKDALVEMKEITPIKTGNARRKTRLQSGNTLVADYPYAGELDDGRSKQAPDGITKPLDEWIGKEVEKIIKRNAT